MRRHLPGLAAAIVALAAAGAGAQVRLDNLSLPLGFAIEVWAAVPLARSMAVTPEGRVYVGSRGPVVHMAEDRDGDGRADRVVRVLDGRHVANGLAWRDGTLYLAEQDRITAWRTTPEGLDPGSAREVFVGLPDKRHHGWRYLAIGPDERLYVAVGAACNICLAPEPEASIVRLRADGSEAEVFARGVRNSVGMDFQPGTGVLWFTDNGGDHLGDDVPPEELNRAPKPGLHFGYPHFAGGDARSPGMPPPPDRTVQPAVTFGAHQAPLGVHFYTGGMFPEAYRGDAFVALHGSWNRTEPAGYKVVRVRFDAAGEPVETLPFVEGWLQEGRAWGRPVDVKTLPDGSLLISDDHAEVLYRVTWTGG